MVNLNGQHAQGKVVVQAVNIIRNHPPSYYSGLSTYQPLYIYMFAYNISSEFTMIPRADSSMGMGGIRRTLFN